MAITSGIEFHSHEAATADVLSPYVFSLASGSPKGIEKGTLVSV